MTWLKHNFWVKVVSLVLAGILFFYVRYQAGLYQTRLISFQLVISKLPPDDLIAPPLGEVKVLATGPPDEMKRFDSMGKRSLFASVDLSNGVAGPAQYRVTVNPRQYFPELSSEVTWEAPPSVTINLAQRLESHKPVTPQAENYPEGWKPNLEVVPSEVAVSGPKEALSKVKQVLAQVDYNGETSTKTRMVPLQCIGQGGTPVTGVSIEPAQVQVTAHFFRSLTNRPLLVVPTFRGQPEFGFKVSGAPAVSPDEVSVSASSQDELKSASTIETEPIDISGVTHTITKTVRLIPSGTLKPKQSTVKVTVRVVPDPNARRTAPPPTTPTPTTTTGSTGGPLSGQ